MSVQQRTKKPPSLTRMLLDSAHRPVDDRTRARAVLHWLDWIGCVAAGARSPVGQVLLRLQAGADSSGTLASLLGHAPDAWTATLLDAGSANVEEMDDMHRQAILHPGPVIMPSLAGLARQVSGQHPHQRVLSAAQTLDAVVRGYEMMIRVGRAVGARHYYFWHNTATAGVFGAAAACADALQLSPDQTVWAMGNAGTQAAGLWQVRLEPVMSKQLHTAHAAWAGRTAATLAAAGFTGPEHILEGERGFFKAMCPDANLHDILRPDADWLIHETSFKPWPACRHTHATIDCVLALRAQAGDVPLPFDACEVESFGDALSICDNPNPQSRTEAKFSLQYCVAAAAALGPLRPEHFDEACYRRPDLMRAAQRVKLKCSSSFDAAYPDHYGARVTLVQQGGPTRVHAVSDCLGDPELPLTPAAVFEKALKLMNYGAVPSSRAQAVLDAAGALLTATLESTPEVLNAPFPIAMLAPLFDS